MNTKLYSIIALGLLFVSLPYSEEILGLENIKEDVKLVYKLLHPFNYDQSIRGLAALGNARLKVDRLAICAQYKKHCGVDIVAKYFIPQYFNTDIGIYVRALFMPLETFYATEIHYAINGPGTDENTLNDVLCCLEYKEIFVSRIVNEYSRLYKSSMKEDVNLDVSSDYYYSKMIAGLIENNRGAPVYFDEYVDAGWNYYGDIQKQNFLEMKGEYAYDKFFAITPSLSILRTNLHFNYLTGGNTTFIEYLEKVTKTYWWPMNYKNFRELVLGIVKYSQGTVDYYADLLKKAAYDNDIRRYIRILAIQGDRNFTILQMAHRKYENEMAFEYAYKTFDELEFHLWRLGITWFNRTHI